MINNNMLCIFAVVLIVISIFTQVIIVFKADQMRDVKITGKATASATGTVSITILRPITDLNFRAILGPDNQSVILIWENMSMDNTSVYITNDLSTGFNLSSPNVTGVANLNWTDGTAVTVNERYYKIGIFRGGSETISSNIVGKFDINLTTANGRWNYISLPLNASNSSRANILRPIANKFDFIYRYKADTGTFDWWMEAAQLGGLVNMTPEYCYIVQALENVTLTVVGDDVLSVNQTLLIDNGRWNYQGWINERTDRANATTSLGANYDFIYEYLADSGSFAFWMQAGFGTITHMRPSKCYIVQPTVNNTMLTYTK